MSTNTIGSGNQNLSIKDSVSARLSAASKDVGQFFGTLAEMIAGLGQVKTEWPNLGTPEELMGSNSRHADKTQGERTEDNGSIGITSTSDVREDALKALKDCFGGTDVKGIEAKDINKALAEEILEAAKEKDEEKLKELLEQITKSNDDDSSSVDAASKDDKAKNPASVKPKESPDTKPKQDDTSQE